jgi:hypothetical protein
VRQIVFEDGNGLLVKINRRKAFKPGPLQTEGKSTTTAKKVNKCQSFHHKPARFCHYKLERFNYKAIFGTILVPDGWNTDLKGQTTKGRRPQNTGKTGKTGTFHAETRRRGEEHSTDAGKRIIHPPVSDDRMASRGATPFGVDGFLARLPRVARGSRPWAGGRNPVGIERANRREISRERKK